MGVGTEMAKLLLAALLLAATACIGADAKFSRHSFPKDFVFGTGSAAYQFSLAMDCYLNKLVPWQYEGAYKEGGKGPSIWDKFTHIPGKILNNETGDVADDMYHRYKEDVKLLKDMNLDAFRFSIAWTRILPNGSLSGGINKEGVAFYNNLINEVIAKGLKPFVTIFHWDTPLALDDKYGGFLSENIIKDYVDFAEVCFKEFGDRVKYWTTFNEPSLYSAHGYSVGKFAPGRCSSYVNKNCFPGDSAREPYIVTHSIILAHAEAVALYNARYKQAQRGQIGITVVSNWYVPNDPNSVADAKAVQRSLDFMYGWFMDPIVHGEYPGTMVGYLRDRLPRFTPEQTKLIKGSYDFIGVNYYTACFASAKPAPNGLEQSYDGDIRANTSGFRNGVPIGKPEFVPIFFEYPQGLRELLLYTKRRYNDPVVYVTENGIAEENNKTIPLEVALKDGHRIRFHSEHLDRFGLIFIDRLNGLKRYRKQSSY